MRASYLPKLRGIVPAPATYYFDATLGNDSNPGSLTRPKKTIAHLNTLELAAGDIVLFKQGETFAGKITPIYSGIVGKPIIYGAYGTGARPIIDGSADKAWKILSSAAHHFRVENLDFTGSINASQHVVQSNTHDQYWYNCIFRDAQGGTAGNGIGFMAFTATGSELYNITLDSCIFHNNSAMGCSIGSVTGAGGPHDCLVTHCEAYENGVTYSLDHGMYSRHGVTWEYNYCHDNPVGAGIKVNCEGVHNSPYTPIVRYNICCNNYIGIVNNNVGSLIYNNLIYANNQYSLAVSGDSNDSKIYFNTFVNVATGNLGGIIAAGANPTGMIVKNNLFIQDAAVHNTEIWKMSAGTAANFAGANTLDYNVYYHDGNAASTIIADNVIDRFTFAQWQAMGVEAHGTHLAALPNFLTRYTNLQPLEAGNFLGLGVAIPGYGVDFNGVARTDPPTPGCYDDPQPEPVSFVSGVVTNNDTDGVYVTFEHTVLASDYGLGVTIKVDGATATITSAVRQVNTAIVCYTLSAAITEGQVITWAYDSAVGDYTNAAGTYDLPTYTAQAITNNVVEFLVNIRFDDGTLNEFDSVVNATGDLTVVDAVGMGDATKMMAVAINDLDADYGIKLTINSTTGIVEANSYIDPNTLTMGESELFGYLLLLNSSNQIAFALNLLYSVGVYYIRPEIFSDDGSIAGSNQSLGTDAPHYVEIRGIRASSDVAADGSIQLWIDGNNKVTLGSKDNYHRFADIASVRFGATVGLDAGTSGTFYLAKLRVNDTGLTIGG